MKDLDVTNLVEEVNGRLFISKTILVEYLSEIYCEFDIELGMLEMTDLGTWTSPNKLYNFDSGNYNDPECGSPCLSKIIFECGPVDDTKFEFAAEQLTTDPYNNQPYHCIDLIREHVIDAGIEITGLQDSDSFINFEISKVQFPELRKAIVDALEAHISMYYWCDEYTCRGSYCDHFEEHEMI